MKVSYGRYCLLAALSLVKIIFRRATKVVQLTEIEIFPLWEMLIGCRKRKFRWKRKCYFGKLRSIQVQACRESVRRKESEKRAGKLKVIIYTYSKPSSRLERNLLAYLSYAQFSGVYLLLELFMLLSRLKRFPLDSSQKTVSFVATLSGFRTMADCVNTGREKLKINSLPWTLPERSFRKPN